ncbi:MAG TPA: glycogen/starch/alpha-glucan phosphorylase [Phycisphaerae bacterium]|nr:glycogen/starch/alpha-glucan phosphorylase [Phycisphaerae bacterium]
MSTLSHTGAQTASKDLLPNGRSLGTVEAIRRSFEHHLKYTLAKDEFSATDRDRYYALAMTIRDRLVERWIQTSQTYYQWDVKRIYYLSVEYLIGRAMGNNVINLGLDETVIGATRQLGLDWNYLCDLERDAALGNGGLGRLAACFLDSIATLELPGYGYGLRYDYGIFHQTIRDGYQVEEPDHWLRHGYPWEIERPEYQFPVGFGGTVTEGRSRSGRLLYRWTPAKTVVGIPYDLPIAGYGNNTVNNLRLWTAKATEEFNLRFFSDGDYMKAYEQKTLSENLTKVLYPDDRVEEGKELRFTQQYFFVSCSLQDIVRRFKATHTHLARFSDKVAIQLNDTHPALGVAELMRLLLDVEEMDWEPAWDITTRTFAYTNHTLMSEALEKWPVRLFEEFLPRHLQIIYEINRRFLRQVTNKFPNDVERLRRMSLIEEGAEKRVRMAHLSVVGSHSTNGVSRIHSELVKRDLFRDFWDLAPEKFNNKTNGITQRRWLLKSNPALAQLITERIGDGWITQLDELERLEPLADDEEFKQDLRRVKRENKGRLAEFIRETRNVGVDPDSLFDVHIKRIHEYKRQLLNVLHIIHRYNRLKDNPALDLVPRTFLFAGKAAPGYAMAKLIIKLVNDLASIVNGDPDVREKMRVVFLSDYNVSLAERIIPAADLSEQISAAGTEASGTGNMKLALNGALTIGTLDGANVEIREAVGPDNFFLFGKTVEEIQALRRSGAYNPWDYYHRFPEIRRVLDCFQGHFLNLEQPGLYRPVWEAILSGGDPYLHLADFHSYVETQDAVDRTYQDTDRWTRMALTNIAHMGPFSSDRTIREYARDIWGVKPCPVELLD